MPRPSRAATFSTSTYRGRISPMSRANSDHRPDCSPSMPAPFPATLISVQGKPPHMTSTAIPSAARRAPVSVRTSSYCGTPGQCFASTRRQKGSISTKAAVLNPLVRSSPKSKAPMPLNSERTESIMGCPISLVMSKRSFANVSRLFTTPFRGADRPTWTVPILGPQCSDRRCRCRGTGRPHCRRPGRSAGRASNAPRAPAWPRSAPSGW